MESLYIWRLCGGFRVAGFVEGVCRSGSECLKFKGLGFGFAIFGLCGSAFYWSRHVISTRLTMYKIARFRRLRLL